ncbi:MAG: hypothetical protein R2831_00290 [Chitinophagaceae bacterium]
MTRRLIRIKAFNVLYQASLNTETTSSELQKNLKNEIINTSLLLVTVYQFLIQLCDYVLVFSNQRSSKHLPTQEDLNINTKLAYNIVIKALKENQSIIDLTKKHKLYNDFDTEYIKKQFLDLQKT